MKTFVKSQIIAAALFAAVITSCKSNTANTEGDGYNNEQSTPSEGMPAQTDTTSTQVDSSASNRTGSGTETPTKTGTDSTGSVPR